MSKYKDQNGDGIINDDDRVIIGNTQPLFLGDYLTYLNLETLMYRLSLVSPTEMMFTTKI